MLVSLNTGDLMIRLGEMVKGDKNALLNVSSEYGNLVHKLAHENTHMLFRCLIISQTEREWRNFPIFVMANFDQIYKKQQFLVDSWQKNNFILKLSNLRTLFNNEKEWKLFLQYFPNPRNDFEYGEKKFEPLFDDGLSKVFYRSRKRDDIILRRLISKHLSKMKKLNDFQVLMLHYVAAQLLDNWESSCLFLGKMIMENWKVKTMRDWFCNTFLIYRQ